MTNKSISEQLIEAAQACLESALALHSNCYIKISETLAQDAIAKDEAFKQLAQEVEDELVARNKRIQRDLKRESLWRELVKEYKVYIPPTLKIIELRKQLGLDND